MEWVDSNTGENLVQMFLNEEEALHWQGSPACEKCRHRLAFHICYDDGSQYCVVCGGTIGECYMDGPP